MTGKWVWILLLGVVVMLGYVRLAPSDPTLWNRPVTAQADADGPGSAVRVIDAGAGMLAAVDHAMMEEPRTTRLAGSVDAGRITYVTRSRVFGFPDYTTVERAGGQIRMFARLRFGSADFGVNRARLERVVAEVRQ